MLCERPGRARPLGSAQGGLSSRAASGLPQAGAKSVALATEVRFQGTPQRLKAAWSEDFFFWHEWNSCPSRFVCPTFGPPLFFSSHLRN